MLRLVEERNLVDTEEEIVSAIDTYKKEVEKLEFMLKCVIEARKYNIKIEFVEKEFTL